MLAVGAQTESKRAHTRRQTASANNNFEKQTCLLLVGDKRRRERLRLGAYALQIEEHVLVRDAKLGHCEFAPQFA